ncbi:Sec-independent protein translocase protein TatB [Aliidiomarina indica]|uniref:Sec-independent protein translocase protein TatB n=1 Tax=Aliidiomarina indica TaxID=2749147 RepID=UPI00188EC879|nr:Sec-independent protein translocase protein TatB [Aliidiomarina indica]
MFDIGFWELLIIAVIGLLVLGPERLPGAIRSLQRSIAKFRAFGSRMEAEINHELRVKELHDHLKQIESAEDMENLSPELKRSLEELQRAAASVRQPYAPELDSGQETSDQESNTPASDQSDNASDPSKPKDS